MFRIARRSRVYAADTTEEAAPFGPVDILMQIKADFIESRSILQETSRARGSFLSRFTGNRSKPGDGAKELEKTFSEIISKLNDLSARTDITLERVPTAIISMRQVEKRLRDNIIAELKAGMINKKYKIDYGGLSKQASSICAEATEVYRNF
ncbi:hypothetical protein V8C35DRAFT_309959 [Trichoderma chlorosporum]